MISRINDRFKTCYEKLPNQIKKTAKKSYKLFKENPFYPSLQFKQIHNSKPIYSIRITKGYRAIGIKNENTIIWFWIGTHNEYEKLISNI